MYRPIVRTLSGILTLVMVTLLADVLFPAATQAQAASISGRVISRDSSAVVGAFILLDSATQPVAQTDADGRFHLENVSPGSHVLGARRVGFAPGRLSIVVAAGERREITLALVPTASSLAAVTVIGSRGDLAELRARVAQVPGATSVVDAAEIRSTRQATLNDVLKMTPGVYVQPRFGAADESQISVRGSGLRNNFHARGINLLVNGMPYRNADGFTDFESLELLTTEAIEIYKGANALRFGGSTLGGAINLTTRTGYTAEPLGAHLTAGSFGYYKTQLSSGSVHGDFDYYVSYARTSLDGYRDWSAQQRDRVNLHAGYRVTPTTDVRAFYFFAHVNEQLPGALTAERAAARPQAADSVNVVNRWGRAYDLHHAGAQFRVQLSPTHRLEISPYVQYRDIDHPIFEVINQQSVDVGSEVRLELTTPLGARSNRLTLGLQPAYETMRNRQFRNERGKHGTLTRDERDRASTLAIYAEDALSITKELTAVAGARADRSGRTVDDDLPSNGDQSDSRRYLAVTPRFGLLYAASPRTQLFANASRTVEPPLFLELTSFGNAGGFIDLKAQDAWQYEVGARGRHSGLAWEIAAYDVELRNEILNINVAPFSGAPFTVPSYRNAARTRHFGLETGAAWRIPLGVMHSQGIADRLIAKASYTFARYRFVEDAEHAGNEIPGAPRHYIGAELAYWHPIGLTLAPSIEAAPTRTVVNSQNTATNPRWVSLSFRGELVRGEGAFFFSANNLTNESVTRSVQVDNAAGKSFEPSDPRGFYAGFRWSK